LIQLKRAYGPATPKDGTRFLVERLWPRGVKKTSLRLDAWVKEVAPSASLRRWFGHDPKKWDEFRRRYFAELDKQIGTWEAILKAAHNGAVTLIYSSHDTEHNNAVALKKYMEAKMRNSAHKRSASAVVQAAKNQLRNFQ
jgi:uncharacterized protein YeaO (DUF488 family)